MVTMKWLSLGTKAARLRKREKSLLCFTLDVISWDFVKYTLIVSHRHKRVYIGGSLKPVASHTDANGFLLCLDETTRDGTKGSGQINSQESVMQFGH